MTKGGQKSYKPLAAWRPGQAADGLAFDLPVSSRFRFSPPGGFSVIRIVFGSLTIFSMLFVTVARAADPDPKDVKAAVGKAYDHLKTIQGADGSFAPKLGGPGVTALIAAGLVRNGYGPDDPVVAKALAYLEKFVQKDGGVYSKE